MRTKIMLIFSVFIFAALNYGIYEKEQIKANGEVLLLKLVPRDPRSLMQGDYMQLAYAITRNLPVKTIDSQQKRGYMVIRSDENNVAEFVRFYQDEKLAAGEKLLHFHKQYSSVRIVPDSFFFQEGHAKYYQNAKYGIFKFDDSKNHLLVGLADENRRAIVVP
ncbi:MAG: hypothetical protein GQ569_12885 [Methylococcaceae bacterium]|nr:hypothetical protein [Methylococcaceae bacterium]